MRWTWMGTTNDTYELYAGHVQTVWTASSRAHALRISEQLGVSAGFIDDVDDGPDIDPEFDAEWLAAQIGGTDPEVIN